MPLLSYLVIKYRFVIAGPYVLYIRFARLTYVIKQVGGVFQSGDITIPNLLQYSNLGVFR